jgi:aldehyde dehydrogenase (NAD+)
MAAWQPLGQGMAEVIDPASEAVAGKVPLGNEADVERAVQAARRAFADWSRTPSSVRAGFIRALADQLKARADEMAAVITASWACRCMVPAGAGRRADRWAEQYIELAGLMDEVREVGNSLVYREAVGVCAFINPWNYPLHQLIGKLAPALAAGCTVVVKPSQETPLHAFVLAEMIEAIGLPAGVFNLVSGPGPRSARRWPAPAGGHGVVHRLHRRGCAYPRRRRRR